MKILSGVVSGRFAFLTTILLILPIGVPSAVAQTSSGSGHEILKVVGHLPLNGMHVNQMFVQRRGEKSYLYLHRPAKDAFALVDVTKPSKPVLLSRDALKEAPGSQVLPPSGGSVLALTVTPEEGQSSASAQLPTETVQLVDMSNPSGAKTLKTFKGVTSVYPDDARKLVYLVNGEGLWIISHHMVRPLPLCTSEAALTPLPDCQ